MKRTNSNLKYNIVSSKHYDIEKLNRTGFIVETVTPKVMEACTNERRPFKISTKRVDS